MLIKIRYCKQNYIHGTLLDNIQDIFYLLKKLYRPISCFYCILLKVQNNLLEISILKSHFADYLTLLKTIEMVLFKENRINFWQLLHMTWFLCRHSARSLDDTFENRKQILAWQFLESEITYCLGKLECNIFAFYCLFLPRPKKPQQPKNPPQLFWI